jgi:hypothetical protein
MKKILLFTVLSCLSFTKIPKERVLVEIHGDLTNDKSDERVVVTELDEEGEFGKIRLLQVFTKKNDKWIELASSKSVIYSSESGGMMGDPFISESIKINNGILEVSQDGGSSWKWFVTHKFRFQKSKFELIGFNHIYGKPCEYFQEIDYNLSTGKIVYKKEFEICEDGEQNKLKDENEVFTKKIQPLPNFKTINVKEIKIVTPKYKNEIYL